MKKLLLSAVAATVFAGTAAVLAQQAAPPAGAPAATPAAPAAAAGRGPNPQQLMFTSRCATCHGTDLQGARAPSLFNHALLNQRTDDQLRKIILEGDSAVDMPAFKDTLSVDEVNQLITFLRVQGGNMRPLPVFTIDPNGQVLKTQKQNVRVEVVASGLDTPFGMSFLPDGRLVISERSGFIRILGKDGTLSERVKNTPTAWVRQDGGYFDIIAHPNYARNGWIYLSYSELVPGYSGPMPPPGLGNAPAGFGPLPPSNTRIVRGKINANNEWVEQQDIVKLPNELYSSPIIHYGQRFLFDGKGHLFWTLGDRGDPANGQNLSNPMGKIHRINDDGSIPKDNPFVGQKDVWPSIWTYGNRNPQGLSYDPRTGLLWESEHGPTGGDEINIIEKGKNYGWAAIADGTLAGITGRSRPGMENPIRSYTPSIGPSGISFYLGNRYPGWKNSLFLTALTGNRLIRYEVKGREILSEETIFQNYGRTRQILTGPDGLLYVLVQNPTGRGTSLGMAAPSPGVVLRLQPLP
jgi:glucose/arabinose dehydrogenase/cytochrome c5